MFNFRFGGQGGSSPTEPTSIETVRRRARHRLIGATLLVLAGVIGFPLLFESQPRPVQTDFEIEIPSRKATAPAVGTDVAVSAAGTVGLDDKEEVVSSPPPLAAPEAVTPPVAAPAPAAVPASPIQAPALNSPPQAVQSQQPAASPKPAEKPLDKPAQRPAEKMAEPKPDDSARALALLEGRPMPAADKPASDDKASTRGRFIVQVGAFVDPALVQQARQKLERSGLATYTQIGNTPDGPRTRVRLGPFDTRAEAQDAADKARALGLSAAILKL